MLPWSPSEVRQCLITSGSKVHLSDLNTDEDEDEEEELSDIDRNGDKKRTGHQHKGKGSHSHSKPVKSQPQECSGTTIEGANVPDIEAELVNLQVEQTDLDNHLWDDDFDEDLNLAEGGVMSSNMKKISQALWSQYMQVVTHLSHKWGMKISQILAEGGAIPPTPGSWSKNVWNAFLHSEKDQHPPRGMWWIFKLWSRY
jgi:hypothetical protein